MSRRKRYYIAEKFLNEPYKTDMMIRKTQRQIQEIRLLMLPAGHDYAKPVVQTSVTDRSSEHMAECVDKLAAHENRLQELQKLYLQQIDEVNEVLDILEKTNTIGALILSHRYIAHMSVNGIAKELHYDRVRISQLNSIALKDVQRILRQQRSKAV